MAGMKFTIDFITNEKQLKDDLRAAYKDAGATLSDEFSESIIKAFKKIGNMKELKEFKGEFTGIFTSLIKGIAGAGENIDLINSSVDKFADEVKFLYDLSKGFKEKHKVDDVFLGFEQKDMNKILKWYKNIEERQERINYLRDQNNSATITKEYLDKNKVGSVQEIKNLLNLPQKKFHDTYDKTMKSFDNKKIEGINSDAIQERIKEFGETIDIIKELEHFDAGEGSQKNIKAQQALVELHKQLKVMVSGDDVISKLLRKELENIKLADVDPTKINKLVQAAIKSEINTLSSKNQVDRSNANKDLADIANKKAFEIKKTRDERYELLRLAAENEGVSLEELDGQLKDTSKVTADVTKALESLSDAMNDVLKSSDTKKIKEKFEELFPKYELLKKRGGLPTSDSDKQLIKDLVALSTRYTDLGGDIKDLLKNETDPAPKAFKNILSGKSATIEPIKGDIEEIIKAIHGMPKQIADSIEDNISVGNGGNNNNVANNDNINAQNGRTGNVDGGAITTAISDESAKELIGKLSSIESSITSVDESIKNGFNDLRQKVDDLKIGDIKDNVSSEIDDKISIIKEDISFIKGKISSLELQDNNSNNLDLLKDVSNKFVVFEKLVDENISNENKTIIIATLQDIKTSVDRLCAKQDSGKSIQFHVGNLDDINKIKSNDNFGNMISDLLVGGINSTGYGWGVAGTGIYTVSNSKINERFDRGNNKTTFGYAIDYSKYDKLYTPQNEDEAIKLLQFLSKLEAFSIKLGASYNGFDEILKGVSIETLYNDYAELFKDEFITEDDFKKFIEEMSNLIKNAGGVTDDMFNNISNELSSSDNIATRFMKLNKYQGVDLHNINSLDNLNMGSVIYDIKPESIIRKFYDSYEMDNYFETISSKIEYSIENVLMEIRDFINSSTDLIKNISIELDKNHTTSTIGDIKKNEKELFSSMNESSDVIEYLSTPISPTQTFDNEIQQNLVMLENYENTLKEIDKLKLEPETDETKAKIEELNKLADYFASKITVIRGENNHDVSKSMMYFNGFPNPYLKEHYESKDIKRFDKVAGDRSGLNIDKVSTEFYGIDEEIKNIEFQSESLRHSLNEALSESRDYVKKLSTKLLDLVDSTLELKTMTDKKDIDDETEWIDNILKKYPELEKFKDKFTSYGAAKDFVKSDEWNDFLATLPKAHVYLEELGYDFEKIKKNSNDIPNQSHIQDVPLSSPDEQLELEQPGIIKVKPNLNPHEFAQEVTDLLKETNAQIGVEPSPDLNAKEFTDKVTTILSGHTVGVDVELNNSKSQNNVNKESVKLNILGESLDEVARKVENKTDAFVDEQNAVGRVVDFEISKLSDLKNSIESVVGVVDKLSEGFQNVSEYAKNPIKIEVKNNGSGDTSLNGSSTTSSNNNIGNQSSQPTDGLNNDTILNEQKYIFDELKKVHGSLEDLEKQLGGAIDVVKQIRKGKDGDYVSFRLTGEKGSAWVGANGNVLRLTTKDKTDYTDKKAKEKQDKKDAKEIFDLVDKQKKAKEKETAIAKKEQEKQEKERQKIIEKGNAKIQKREEKEQKDKEKQEVAAQKAKEKKEAQRQKLYAKDAFDQVASQKKEQEKQEKAKEKQETKRQNLYAQDAFKQARAQKKEQDKKEQERQKIIEQGKKKIQQREEAEQKSQEKKELEQAKANAKRRINAIENTLKLSDSENKYFTDSYYKNLFESQVGQSATATFKDQRDATHWQGALVENEMQKIVDSFSNLINEEKKLDEVKKKYDKDNVTYAERLAEQIERVNTARKEFNELNAEEFYEGNKVGINTTLSKKYEEQKTKLKDIELDRLSRNNSNNESGNADELLEKRINRIFELTKKLDFYKDKIDRYPEEYQRKILDAVEQLKLFSDTPDIVSDDDLNSIDKLTSKLKNVDKIAKESRIEKLAGNITLFMKQNSKMSKETTLEFQGLINQLKKGDILESEIDSITTSFERLKREVRETGESGKSFFDIFRQKLTYITAQQIAMYFSFNDIIRYARTAAQSVINLNTQFTELAKVSDTSIKQLESDFSSYANTAKEIGGTISDTISATADWARMGYNIPDSKELARVALIYKNVGDGIDISAANESLISTLQGFQMEANDAMEIVDKFNEVSNNFAISSSGIGEALQRSAAAFNAANTDLSKSIALVTTSNIVLQDPDSVGTLWKTLSARIRGAKTELEDLGEEEDEFTETTSKLRGLVKSLTGFDIMKDDDTFKDIYEIMIGIGKEWKNLTDVEQASLGEALAGKRNANALYAVLNNIEDLEKAYSTAENSAGSAMREQERYQQSIQYSIDQTKASLEELASTVISSDLLKYLVDVANAFTNIATQITKFGGLAGLIGGGIGFAAGFTNKSLDIFGLGTKRKNKKQIKLGKQGLAQYTHDMQNITDPNAINAIWNNAFENTTGSVRELAEQLKEGTITADQFETSLNELGNKAKISTSLFSGFKNILNGIGKGLLVGAISFGIEKLISAIYELATIDDKIAEAANEASSQINNTSKSIDNYKDRINELKEVINDSESSEEQVIQARRDLIGVQEEIVKQFKNEAEATDIVTEAINKQTNALDKLKSKNYQLAENKFNESSWLETRWLHLNGYKDRLDKMEKDYLSERTEYYRFGQSDNITDDLIQKMRELGAEFKVYERVGNNLRDATESDNLVELIKNADDQIDVELTLAGNAEEVYDKVLDLQNLIGNTDGLDDLNDELKELATTYSKLDEEYGDFAKQYVINRKILSNDEYAESYLDIINKREAYVEAYTSGDKDKIEQTTRDFMQARQDAILKSGSDPIAQKFFTNMFEDEMANAIKDVNFKDKLSSDTLFKKLLPYLGDDFKSSYKQYQDYIEDGLEYTDSKVKEELDHLQLLVQDFYDSLSKEDIIKVEALDGYEEQVLDAMDKINLDLVKGTGETLNKYIGSVANEFNIDEDSVRTIFNAYSNALTVAGKNANPEEFIQAFMDGASSFDMDTETLLSIAGQVVNYALEDVSKEDINKAVEEASSKIGITSTEFNNTYSASINGVFALIDAIKESGYDVETALELIGIKSKEDIDLQNELTKAIAQNIKNTKDRITSLYETLEKINSGDLTSDELIDFLSDEDNAKFLKSVDNLGNAIDDEIKSQLDEAKKLIGDASPELIDALDKSVEKAKFSTHFSKINEDIDKLQEGMKTLSSAFEEYNENGFITLDTLQSLVTADENYIQMLTIENGQLKINEEAYKAQMAVKLNDFKLTLDKAAAAEINALAESKTTEKIESNVDALNAETIAYGENTTAAINNALNKNVTNEEINEIIKKYDAIYGAAVKGYKDNFNEFSGATSSAAKDASDTAKEELDNYIALQDALLDAGKISFQDYCTNVKSKLDDMYNSGKLSAKDYFDSVKTFLEKQQSIYDKVLSAVEKRFDKEIEGIDEQINAINKENEALDKQKEEYDKILSVVQEVYDNEIKSLNDQKDAIQEKIDALQDANDEEDRALALANARYALEKAQQQRTRLVYSGEQGFVYKQDEEAIRSAKKELKQAELDNTISLLEKEQEVLDKDIEKLEEYKEKWSEVSETYDKEVNRQLAIQMFGENYEQIILNSREQDIQNFTDKYVELQKKQNDNSELIKSLEEKKEYYEELKKQWQEITSIYEESIDRQHTASVLGADWEQSILKGRTDVLEKFKNDYISIQEQIKQAAIDSAKAQADADKGGSGSGGGGGYNFDTSGSNNTKGTYHVQDKYGNVYGGEFFSEDDAKAYMKSSEFATLAYKVANKYKEDPGFIIKLDEFNHGFRIYDSDKKDALKGDYNSVDEAKAAIEKDKELLEKYKKGKLSIQAFSNGGVISAKSNKSPLTELANRFGEDTPILAKHGERILTPVQNKYWEKWTNALPNLTKNIDALKFNLPNFGSILGAIANKETTVKQEISISLPNVTNTSGAEYVLNALKTLPLEAVQRVNRR